MTKTPDYLLLTVSGQCRSPSRDHFQSLYAKSRRRRCEELERLQRRDLRHEQINRR